MGDTIGEIHRDGKRLQSISPQELEKEIQERIEWAERELREFKKDLKKRKTIEGKLLCVERWGDTLGVRARGIERLKGYRGSGKADL